MAIKKISEFTVGTPTSSDKILFEQNGNGKSASLNQLGATHNHTFLVEKIRVLDKNATSSYYINISKSLAKPGYQLLGIIGYESNQAKTKFYKILTENDSAYIGVSVAESDNLSETTVDIYSLYVKTNGSVTTNG